MSWDTDYLLEGLTTFGAPLNIWKWEVYQQDPGYQPLDYHRIHMNLDNDPDLFDTLMKKLRNGGTIHYYQRLIIMRKMAQNTPGRDYTFYNAWLYSLEWRYLPSQYPYQHWKGPTLGIAFEKTPPNVAAVKSLGIHG